MIRLVLVAFLSIFPSFSEQEDAQHLFVIGGLEVLHPWTPEPSGSDAFLYMELLNKGRAPVQILSAQTPDGIYGTMVGFVMRSGEMGFEPLPALPIGAGQRLDFEPDVLAIRFDSPETPLREGDLWEVVLQTSAGTLPLLVAVESKDARQHSHAGHSH